LLAARGIGLLMREDLAQRTLPTVRYESVMSEEERNMRHARWANAVSRMLDQGNRVL